MYKAIKFELKNIKTPEEYNNLVNSDKFEVFKTLNDAFNFCGGRLPRVGYGYSGSVGDYECFICKI